MEAEVEALFGSSPRSSALNFQSKCSSRALDQLQSHFQSRPRPRLVLYPYRPTNTYKVEHPYTKPATTLSTYPICPNTDEDLELFIGDPGPASEQVSIRE